MKEGTRAGSEQEQALCRECGFCCDGTLFSYAKLVKGETLPDWIAKNSFTSNGAEYFRQPCGYFNGCCTIYGGNRAFICADYRCMLLNDFAAGKLSAVEAASIVKEAKEMRSLVMDLCRHYFGIGENVSFREVMSDLESFIAGARKNGIDSDTDSLIARCNIFSALLVKHFGGEDRFGMLVMR